MIPKRITTRQGKRPPNARLVDATSYWRNPFAADYPPAEAIERFRAWLEDDEKGRKVAADARRELRGKNLACTCKPGEPCHADVLIEIANPQPKADERTAATERAVIGSILADPSGEIGSNLAQVLADAELMQDPQARSVAVAIRAARDNGGLQTTLDVAKYLTQGEYPLLESLAAGKDVMPLSAADVEAGELVHRLRGIDAQRELATAYQAGKDDPNAALRVLEQLASKPRKVTAEPLEKRLVNLTTEPPPLRAVYTLAGKPLCTCGNLTTLTGPPKAAKSSAMAAMAASTMVDSHDADCLGFASSNDEGKALLWFDSEQAPDDFWHLVRRAIDRAGRTEPPAWLRPYSLTGMNSAEAWRFALSAIRADSAAFGGIHSIILDGSADFVADVNDAELCNGFVATLHGLAIDYVCPIVGVLHFNPGTEKGRGHLGSQLERKSESNLRIERDGEASVLWSDKQRRAPIPRNTGPRFVWSEEHGRHVSTVSLGQSKDDIAREALTEYANELYAKRPAYRYSELQKALAELLNCDIRATERKVKDMTRLGVVVKSVAGLYAKGA